MKKHKHKWIKVGGRFENGKQVLVIKECQICGKRKVIRK